MDVRAVKAAQEGLGLFAAKQTVHNLGLRFLIGGRGEGRQRHTQSAAQFADAQVVWAEVMAPLADAVCLVYCDQGHASLGQHALRST